MESDPKTKTENGVLIWASQASRRKNVIPARLKEMSVRNGRLVVTARVSSGPGYAEVDVHLTPEEMLAWLPEALTSKVRTLESDIRYETMKMSLKAAEDLATNYIDPDKFVDAVRSQRSK